MRFLVSFVLSVILIDALLIVPLAMLDFFAEGVLIMGLMGIAGVGIYLLSRTRAYKIAYPTSMALILLFVLAMLREYPNAHTAVLALLPIFMSSLFYDLRGIIVTTVLSLAVVEGASIIFPGDWYALPLTFGYIVGSTALTVLSNWLLRQSEANLQTRSIQLLHSQSRFRAAIDGSLNSFYILEYRDGSADWIILEANRLAEQQSGIPRTTVPARILQASMLPAGCGEVLLNRCQEALHRTETISDILVTLDDHSYEYVIVPFNECVALTIHDITERKKTEKQSLDLAIERERVALLQQIIGDASHDMMSPLSVVKTNVYLIKQAVDEETRAPRLAAVEQQVVRLQHMIRDLATMSELDHLSSSKLIRMRMDVNELIKDIGSAYDAMAMVQQHTLVTQFHSQPMTVFIDRARMEAAFTNLIENAFKYTPVGSTVTVSVHASEGGVAIDVRDNGKGISEQDLPHLFDRYYRAEEHRPTHSDIPGTGLGLTIVKKIVEAHQGRVSAQNAPEGGALFRVWLPLVSEADAVKMLPTAANKKPL
ncbi:MAG: hypothetical protein KF716_04405 [Anaerolineae bacterium]|nr:hypothetical protein [Anaerolineae bacterium]